MDAFAGVVDPKRRTLLAAAVAGIYFYPFAVLATPPPAIQD